MRTMQSFLIFYYILDQGYYECEEYYKYEDNGIRYGELSCFLSAISPEIWGDGQPMDKTVLDEWEEFSNPKEVDMNNIMEKTYAFLDYYGEKFDYDFSGIKQCLLATADNTTVQKAYDKSQLMYQEFQYTN